MKLLKNETYNNFLLLLENNNRELINKFKLQNLLYIESNLNFDRYLTDEEVIDYFIYEK
jgi:hypothetical protein